MTLIPLIRRWKSRRTGWTGSAHFAEYNNRCGILIKGLDFIMTGIIIYHLQQSVSVSVTDRVGQTGHPA